jgi:serine/threonine-protein kinase HipA
MRQAKVFYNHRYAGTLTENDDRTYHFRYADDYFKDQSTYPVSLTLPKTKQEHTCAVLFPFFFNMLSEGVNKHLQCQAFRIDENDYFSLLTTTAQFETIGPVTVIPDE